MLSGPQLCSCKLHIHARDLQHGLCSLASNHDCHLRRSAHLPRARQHLWRPAAQAHQQHLHLVARARNDDPHHRRLSGCAFAPVRPVRLQYLRGQHWSRWRAGMEPARQPCIRCSHWHSLRAVFAYG